MTESSKPSEQEVVSASLLNEADRRRLDALRQRMAEGVTHFAGYPVNAVFDYRELDDLLRIPLNNVGDPWSCSLFGLNTHDFERDVVRWFARLTRVPEGECWGYVTSGGTEGNLYGIFLGRELYPEGMLYYSEDTHYSVAKVLRMLHVRNLMVRSEPDGRIDLHDLRETLNLHRDVPPILFLNAGTTMKGAVDDLRGVRHLLKELAIRDYYIHVDAALSGMILPFVEVRDPFDFQDGAHSLSISGHKFVGSPLPCGVALARRRIVDRIRRRGAHSDGARLEGFYREHDRRRGPGRTGRARPTRQALQQCRRQLAQCAVHRAASGQGAGGHQCAR